MVFFGFRFSLPKPDKEKQGKSGRLINPDRSLFQKFNGLTRTESKQLLIKCTKSSHFIFNNKFYDQIDGLAMCCPLAPLFENIFMDSNEKKIMPKLKKLGVKCWLRYFDDTFLVIEDHNSKKSIVDLLNSHIRISDLHRKKNQITALLFQMSKLTVDYTQQSTVILRSLSFIYDGRALHQLSTTRYFLLFRHQLTQS